jgi:hypothetical protein
MKNLVISLVLLILSITSFSQSPDYSITLGANESFVKISGSQMTDSVNLNQTGPEQFEYFEIRLTSKDLSNLDAFMKNCKSIQSILNKYGKVRLDITTGTHGDIIRPLSGFYYAVDYVKLYSGNQLTLMVIYPRRDKM